MRKKVLALCTTLLLTSVLSTTVFAASKTWENYTLTNWDKPISGTFEANKINNTTAYNQLTFWWAPSQVDFMQDDYTLNLPSFEFKDNYNNDLSPVGVSTTLPDPKFDYDDDDSDGINDEIEVVSRDKESIQHTINYNFYATWSKSSSNTTNPYMIAYSAMSTNWTLNGEHNDIIGSNDTLGGIRWNDMSLARSTVSPMNYDEKLSLIEKFEQSTPSFTPTVIDAPSENNQKYLEIDNKVKLEEYKLNTQQKVALLNDTDQFKAMITLENPISLKESVELIGSNNITPTQVVGRAYNEKNETVTISLPVATQEALDNLIQNQNLTFVGFTEIEGSTTGEKMKMLQESHNIYSIEIENNEQIPHGLYWKKEKLK